MAPERSAIAKGRAAKDGRRLDELAKVLAAQQSRRGVVRVLATSLGGSLAGVMGRRRRADAHTVSLLGQSDETEAGFEDCGGGKCDPPVSQLQNTPYQVWCRPSVKTNTSPGCTAQGCRCHLHWKKKTASAWDYGADQNVKTGIKDSDGIYKLEYDYTCFCQKAKAAGSTTPDDAAQALPDLASAFVLPEGFALEQGRMIFVLGDLDSVPSVEKFTLGLEMTMSRCFAEAPCDDVRISVIAHVDEAAASATTEAVFFGLPANAINMTGAYLLSGVGQSQFTVSYPIEDDAGLREAARTGFHVGAFSGDVLWASGSLNVDAAYLTAEEMARLFVTLSEQMPVPGASSLALRFQGEFSNLVVPLVEEGNPIPLAGRTPNELAIYNQEFASVLNGVRWRHELPGAEGAPSLIVINTVLQMPDLEAAQAYLDRWPGSYQPVLDLQGIEGEVIDPPVLLGDEGYHSAYAFSLRMQDERVVDGLNLAGLFQGPTSTWFASVSLRSTEARDQNLDPAALEQLQADLRAIAGSGFISAYDSLFRTALNGGPDYQHVLLPPVPMPDLQRR